MITTQTELDVSPGGIAPVIHVSQYDTGSRTLLFNLIATAGDLILPTGTKAEIRGTKPDGNALQNILERFISNAKEEASLTGRNAYDIIAEKLNELSDYTGGFSFITVIKKYLEGYESGNQDLMNNSLKWLKAGYTTKIDTLRDLGIREFISDASFYNTLKLYSVLVRKAGYKGLLVCMDEMVNLYKITAKILS